MKYDNDTGTHVHASVTAMHSHMKKPCCLGMSTMSCALRTITTKYGTVDGIRDFVLVGRERRSLEGIRRIIK